MMPNFHHDLMGIGPLCDHGCCVVFEQTKVTVFSKDSTELLRGWRETTGSKLWRFSLRPGDHPTPSPDWSNVPTALNAHDLPSVGALVRYLHATTGSPSQVYLARGHQGRELLLLARPHLRQVDLTGEPVVACR